MSALADIFSVVRLQLDGTGFEAQATALADKSGKNVGDRLSQQLSSKLKSAAAAGIGMAAGAAFGMALTGAKELDAATKQLQADTGMTAEAAGKAEDALAGMYQHNLQGFAGIGATMAVVINGLDLTGAAADAMTEKFLRFETATGQDSSAVQSFHEILNAWGLDASSAAHVMDLLVASHEKYGSSIADNQASLQRLAPQMKAMNMSIDDTVNLLNLFDAAGLDASKAQFALNTAVKNLKPGQTFNDLIAQITAIQDPTLRAQEAITIFGARGGVNLANALKPGITSLADFATSASDTAGATDKAAAAVESGFGAQATLLVHNFGGALADLSTNFGPLLMVAATIGPRFTTALLAGLGGIGGLLVTSAIPKIAGELTSTAGLMPWMTTGTVIGKALAAAIGVGMTVGIPIAIVTGLQAAKPDIQNWLDSMGLKVPNLFEGQGALAPRGPIVAETRLQTLYPEGNAAAHEAAMKAAGASDAAAIAAGLAAGAPKALAASKDLGYNVLSGFLGPLQFSADKVLAAFGTTLASVNAAWKQTGSDGMFALAAGIAAARQAPLDAFDTMKTMLKNSMTPIAEAARLIGQLTSKDLARGIRDGREDVRAQAIGVAKDTADRLGEIALHGGRAGAQAMLALDAGIRSKIPEVSAASLAAKNAAVAQLNATAGPAATAGAAAGTAFANAMRPKVNAAMTAAQARVSGSTVTRFGGQATGGPYPTGQVNWVGEKGPELRVAASPGYTLTHQEAMSIASGSLSRGGGGPTYNVTVNNPNPRAAPDDIGRMLRRISALGMA